MQLCVVISNLWRHHAHVRCRSARCLPSTFVKYSGKTQNSTGFAVSSHSTDDSTPILVMISIPILLLILLPIQRWFYSHFTDDFTPILLMILLPIYWWFYSHSTNDSTPNILMILLSFYWWFYSQSTDDSTPNLLMILLSFYWWFYPHSTDDSAPILLMIILQFYFFPGKIKVNQIIRCTICGEYHVFTPSSEEVHTMGPRSYTSRINPRFYSHSTPILPAFYFILLPFCSRI